MMLRRKNGLCTSCELPTTMADLLRKIDQRLIVNATVGEKICLTYMVMLALLLGGPVRWQGNAGDNETAACMRMS